MICHIFALVHEHLHGDDYLGPSEGIRGPATQSHASEKQKTGSKRRLYLNVTSMGKFQTKLSSTLSEEVETCSRWMSEEVTRSSG